MMIPNNYSMPLQTYAYVSGFEGAKAYQVMPNQTMLLMDNENPIFYMKSTNPLGQATIKAYKFEELKQSTPSETDYVALSDFNDLKDKVDKLLEEVKKNNG